MTDFEITIYDYVEYDKPEELASYELDISEEASKILTGQDIHFVEKLEEIGVRSHLDVICAILIKKLSEIMKNQATEDNIDYLADQISETAVSSVENEAYLPFSFAFGEEKYMELEVVKHTEFEF